MQNEFEESEDWKTLRVVESESIATRFAVFSWAGLLQLGQTARTLGLIEHPSRSRGASMLRTSADSPHQPEGSESGQARPSTARPKGDLIGDLASRDAFGWSNQNGSRPGS